MPDLSREWAVLYSSPFGSHLIEYGSDEKGARREAEVERAGNCTAELLSRPARLWELAQPADGCTCDGTTVGPCPTDCPVCAQLPAAASCYREGHPTRWQRPDSPHRIQYDDWGQAVMTPGEPSRS